MNSDKAQEIRRPPHINLQDLIPASCFQHPKCFDPLYYVDWERNVANTALIRKGWQVASWHTGERDSFGPLSRYMMVELHGKTYKIWYG